MGGYILNSIFTATYGQRIRGRQTKSPDDVTGEEKDKEPR